MSSRIIAHGRVASASRDTPWHRPTLYPTNRRGEPIVIAEVDPGGPDAPWHPHGGTLYDADLGLEFRVVGPGVLDPAQGWASADFWCRRWKADFEKHVVPLTRKGWIDAAAERGSPTRKFRCRDESRCLEWIAETKRRRTRKSQ